MRLTVRMLGVEILHITTDQEIADDPSIPGTVASQVERAGPSDFGFAVTSRHVRPLIEE